MSRLMMRLSRSQMSVLEGISSCLDTCQSKISQSGSQHVPARGGPGAAVCLLSGSSINILSTHGTSTLIKPMC